MSPQRHHPRQGIAPPLADAMDHIRKAETCGRCSADGIHDCTCYLHCGSRLAPSIAHEAPVPIASHEFFDSHLEVPEGFQHVDMDLSYELASALRKKGYVDGTAAAGRIRVAIESDGEYRVALCDDTGRPLVAEDATDLRSGCDVASKFLSTEKDAVFEFPADEHYKSFRKTGHFDDVRRVPSLSYMETEDGKGMYTGRIHDEDGKLNPWACYIAKTVSGGSMVLDSHGGRATHFSVPAKYYGEHHKRFSEIVNASPNIAAGLKVRIFPGRGSQFVLNVRVFVEDIYSVSHSDPHLNLSQTDGGHVRAAPARSPVLAGAKAGKAMRARHADARLEGMHPLVHGKDKHGKLVAIGWHHHGTGVHHTVPQVSHDIEADTRHMQAALDCVPASEATPSVAPSSKGRDESSESSEDEDDTSTVSSKTVEGYVHVPEKAFEEGPGPPADHLSELDDGLSVAESEVASAHTPAPREDDTHSIASSGDDDGSVDSYRTDLGEHN